MAKILALFRWSFAFMRDKMARRHSVESHDEGYKTRKRSGIDRPAPRLFIARVFHDDYHDAASRRPPPPPYVAYRDIHVRNCRASSSAIRVSDYSFIPCTRALGMWQCFGSRRSIHPLYCGVVSHFLSPFLSTFTPPPTTCT